MKKISIEVLKISYQLQGAVISYRERVFTENRDEAFLRYRVLRNMFSEKGAYIGFNDKFF